MLKAIHTEFEVYSFNNFIHSSKQKQNLSTIS